MATTAREVPFEFCETCFALRDVHTGLYLSASHRTSPDAALNVTLVPWKFFLWRYRARAGPAARTLDAF
jgi:hypothetical protein